MSDRTRHRTVHSMVSRDDKEYDLTAAAGDSGEMRHSLSSLRGDWCSVSLLTFLYILQGIPLGLAAAIPMILQNRNVTYKEQAIFSFVHWPFSLKLLWAPIVDSCYLTSFGRRKTWLIPTQYFIGFFLILLSYNSHVMLGTDASPPNVPCVTLLFFMLCFLAATQDIAVDGWALTMLSRRNVGYASTCNCVGQTTGYFLGFVVFLALESEKFANQYLRTEPAAGGLVTVSGYFYFWGLIFLLTTTVVCIFKKENSRKNEEVGSHKELELGVLETYRVLWKIINLPAMRILIVFLLTCKVGFSPADGVTGLKLTEKGVPKDKLALIAVPLIPLQILLPLIISRYTTGSKPLTIYRKAYPWRLLFSIVFCVIVWMTPYMEIVKGEFPLSYYATIVVMYSLHQVTVYSMFVAAMGFFARISDPSIGGTYMTLLNTLSNLGGNWPVTIALWFVDSLTFKSCYNVCNSVPEVPKCGEVCDTSLDGYYVESGVCLLLGFLWLLTFGAKQMHRLQSAPLSVWKCT